jgi:hypothetical protein
MPGSGERIWYRDLHGFMSDRNVIKFVPDATMSRVEQLNSLMRFSMYLSVLLMIARRSVGPAFIAAFVAALTWGLYESHETDQKRMEGMLSEQDVQKDRRTGRVCTKPSLHNPFMNVLSVDPVVRPHRPAACNVQRSDVKRRMESAYAHNLYRDSDDPLNRNSSSRQFYTMPVTTIPGDQNAFAKWCFGVGPTCKEGNGGRCALLAQRPYVR